MTDTENYSTTENIKSFLEKIYKKLIQEGANFYIPIPRHVLLVF